MPSERPRKLSGTSTCASSPWPASASRTVAASPAGSRVPRNDGRDLAGRRGHHEPGLLGEQDHHPARAHERAPALDDQLEHAVEVGLAADRARDRGRRLEPAHGRLELVPAALGGLVEAGVLDRDPGPLGEDHDRVLVGRRERGAALLLGQVEVAPGLAADQHRRAEERRHRRVAGREAVGAGVVADAGQPQRPRILDQHAEDAAPAREVADRAPPLGVDAVREEALELAPLVVEDAERDVARAR